MDALQFYAIAFIVIWTLALLFKDKLKIDIYGPVLMRRTTKLRGLIDSIAQKSPRFWKVSMKIGIPIAVFFMILMFVILGYDLGKTIITILTTSTKTVQSGIAIALPGVSIKGSPFTVPLGYGFAALITVLVVHEFAHGILARAEGIKLKSIGLMIMAVIPGAFVEPDEDDMKKSSKLARLRITAAGSIFNIGFAAIALVLAIILSSFVIGPSFDSDGLKVVGVMSDTPADGVLKEGMIITNINGHDIKNRTDFTNVLNKTKPGDILTIKTDQGTFTIKTTNNPNNSSAPYIGVSTQENLVIKKDISSKYGDILPWIVYDFNILLGWIYILNFGIGTFNLLPAKPLDGGAMLEELLNYKISKDISSKITNVISVISWMLVIFTISLSLILAYS